MSALGFEEGDICGREGCDGRIEIKPPENCSCHIAPPCSACTAPRAFCPECDWHEVHEPEPVRPPQSQAERDAWASYVKEQDRLRSVPLDSTRISYRSMSHSSCSMIKEGVYPQSGDDAADRAAVRKEVDGTFGGRFESFGNGRFKFIAYTD